MRLTILDRLPDGFVDAAPAALADLVPGPTLFDLAGRMRDPLFVSVLLHGDEDTGLLAVQDVLRRHGSDALPRRLLLFVGNVAAAAAGRRKLDDQLDFNRVWPGTPRSETPEARLMQDVVDYAAAQRPFASIDIHSNTGLNPHYACINRLEDRYLHLARLFSRTVVFFERPLGVQSAAMARVCPAVTIECGKSGDPAAVPHASGFIEACLALTHFPDHPPQPADFDLLRTFAIVKVPEGASFSFDGSRADIRFRDDIDRLNFSEVAPGTLLATLANGARARLDVVLDEHAPVAEYFDYSDDRIRLAQPAIPSMLTRNAEAVRLDCLCYLMHRIDASGRPLAP